MQRRTTGTWAQRLNHHRLGPGFGAHSAASSSSQVGRLRVETQTFLLLLLLLVSLLLLAGPAAGCSDAAAQHRGGCTGPDPQADCIQVRRMHTTFEGLLFLLTPVQFFSQLPVVAGPVSVVCWQDRDRTQQEGHQLKKVVCEPQMHSLLVAGICKAPRTTSQPTSSTTRTALASTTTTSTSRRPMRLPQTRPAAAARGARCRWSARRVLRCS